MTRIQLWAREVRVWLPALVFFLVNAALAVNYETRYADEDELAARSLQEARAELEVLEEREAALAQLSSKARKNRRRIERFYKNSLGTEDERLTSIISEVKSLAERAGLEPTTIRYPDQAFGELGLASHEINFTVDGTYDGLRRFVNMLELSESFLTLDEMRPSGGAGSGANLRITVSISTLFVQEGVDPADLARHRRTVL